MRYEAILNKISPLFYKFLNYKMSITIPIRIVLDYLKRFRVPQEIVVELPIAYVNYIYAIKFIESTSPLRGKTSSGHIMLLTKKDNISEFRHVIIDEFIVNMVINKFSFERSYITSGYTVYPQRYKYLFIALVGKDLYDALRSSVE
jgi:hypothetical protein